MSKFLVSVRVELDHTEQVITVEADHFLVEKDNLHFMTGDKVIAAFSSWLRVVPDTVNENVELKKYQAFCEIVKNLTVGHSDSDDIPAGTGAAVVFVDKLDKALQSVDPVWFDKLTAKK